MYPRLQRFMASLGLALALSMPVQAAEPPKEFSFEDLKGSWSGGGRVHFDSGTTERISCRTTYRPSGKTAMSMTIRCATESFSINAEVELRRNGNRLSGSWTESSFQKSGHLGGSVNGTTLHVQFKAAGETESTLSVTTKGSSQSITMRPLGTPVTHIAISLSRR